MHELSGDRPEPEVFAPAAWLLRDTVGEEYLVPEDMLAAEQMFFLGAPLAHVIDYEAHQRTLRMHPVRSNAARYSRLAQAPEECLPGLDPVTDR